MKISKKLQLLALSILLLSLKTSAQSEPAPHLNAAPAHPFGSHSQPYRAGTIKPSISQANLDQAVRTFYNQWKAKYLVQGCGAGRYYVYSGDAVGGNNISVSEGHGYGMVIVAIMAGHDPNAQTIFDGLYLFFRDHPSVNNPNLMAWNQVKGCGNIDGNNTDSATDGDLDIAYSLLLANRQWGSDGDVNYLGEAKKVIAAILSREIRPSVNTVLLGDWVTSDVSKYFNGTRTSDFIFDHFKAFRKIQNRRRWRKVTDKAYSLVNLLQAGFSPNTGLLPDFAVEVATAAPRPAGPGFLEGPRDGDYSFNACRTPWRIGTDYLLNGDQRAYAALQPLNQWIKAATGGNPNRIYDGYSLPGQRLGGTSAGELSFIAPFAVAAMSDASNQAWLDALWNTITATKIGDSQYYGNTIKMYTMIVISRNYWVP